MGDYIKIAADGSVITDLSALTKEQWSAVSELTVEELFDNRRKEGDKKIGQRVKIKMCDKRAALVDLGKTQGMFIDTKVQLGPDGKPVDNRQTFVLNIER